MSPKETLRGEMKRRLKGIPREEFKAQGAASAALLRSSIIWDCYNTFFLFLSTNSEIDTQPLLESALKDGKKVFVPKISFVPKGGQALVFYNVISAEGPWEKGAFGIREPAGGKPAAAIDFHLAVIVVPGLAFDRNGNRLGKGGGFYDRFLGELDAEGCVHNVIGLCMDFQVIESVPTEEKDKKVVCILTHNELMETSK
jgi:5-formyltetrahydrofolate cyclo-ligase